MTMRNEYKDWLWDNYAESAIEAGLFDRVIQIIPYDEFYATVHGIKNGYHMKYNVWYDEVAERWVYERSED